MRACTHVGVDLSKQMFYEYCACEYQGLGIRMILVLWNKIPCFKILNNNISLKVEKKNPDMVSSHSFGFEVHWIQQLKLGGRMKGEGFWL